MKNEMQKSWDKFTKTPSYQNMKNFYSSFGINQTMMDNNAQTIFAAAFFYANEVKGKTLKSKS